MNDSLLQSEKIRLIMQLRRNGITDTRVLSAIEAVPRELFVSAQFADRAYDDTALPIEKDQTISQPTVVAHMTQALQLEERHMVLEVGTGSGYQSAILSKLARRVHTIERHKELYALAGERFERLQLRNITAHLGDGSKGWPHAAPYERIMVTAAAEEMPELLLDQLAEGGVMVMPYGGGANAQKLLRLRKKDGQLEQEAFMDVRFVPLVAAS